MADYDVEADLPDLLEALRKRGDLVSVRAAEAIEHLRPKRKRRVCDDCIGRSDGEAVVCVHMLDEPDDGLKWWFLLVCRECDGEDPGNWKAMPFTTENDREDWADEHAKATGHDTWSNWREAVTAGETPGALFAQHSPLAVGPIAAPTRLTREQVREAIYAHLGPKAGVGPATDAVMALIEGVAAEIVDELRAAGHLRASGEGTAPPPADEELRGAAVRLLDLLDSDVIDRPQTVGEVVERVKRYGTALDEAKATLRSLAGRGTAPQVPAEAAWEGQTEPMVTDATPAHSNLYRLPFAPGTYVRVVAADGAPPEETEPEAVMPRVGGKPFRCECGGNVFTRNGSVYSCNSCPREYEGTPARPTLAESIEERRADLEFMARIKASVERNRPLLDRLAEIDGPEDP